MSVHPTACVNPKAKIGINVKIGAYTLIHENVVIKDDCNIGSFCELGISTTLAKNKELIIGERSIIRSHAVIYQGSKLGKELNTGHYVTIRENTDIGENCQIGSRGDLQGDCIIGNFTKMHSDVHIGKKSVIGNYVWLFPEVLLTNDPTPPSESLIGVTIKDFAVLAAKVLVLPGVVVEEEAVVSAGSIVKSNVPKGMLVSGSPAKVRCAANILRFHENPKIKAYPWKYRFHRGYTFDDVQSWIKELEEND